MKRLILLAVLLFVSSAFGQLVLVGGCAAAATSCTPVVKTGKTFAAGQFIYSFAFRTATGAPTLDGGFSNVNSASGSSSSFHSGCAVSTSGSPSSGTWTNATAIVTLIYSGTAATTTGNCLSKGVGGNATGSGTGTTVTYTGLTMTQSNGTSWVIGAVGDSTTACTPATVLVSEENSGTAIIGNDTNGGVSSFSALTCTGSGNWKTNTLEILTPQVGTHQLMLMGVGL